MKKKTQENKDNALYAKVSLEIQNVVRAIPFLKLKKLQKLGQWDINFNAFTPIQTFTTLLTSSSLTTAKSQFLSFAFYYNFLSAYLFFFIQGYLLDDFLLFSVIYWLSISFRSFLLYCRYFSQWIQIWRVELWNNIAEADLFKTRSCSIRERDIT